MQSKIYLISSAGSGIGPAIAQKLAATQYRILLERKESGLKEKRCDNEQLMLLLSPINC